MSRSEYSDDCDGFHKQQIKDIAKHLLELKQSVTLMGRSREVVLQYG